MKTEKQSKKKSKICFLICPIGEENSDVRNRSDKILKNIILPAAKGYNVIRADEISMSGSISKQIIKHLLTADLVIADLSGHNPNVFYELAVRHMTKKPYIQLIQKGEKLPFDIKDIRTIPIDQENHSIIMKAQGEIKKQIKTIENNKDVDNPITVLWSEVIDVFSQHVQLPNINQDLVYEGKKFTLFRSREKMIEYFDAMYNKAETTGDEIWAQGVGHTAYTPNFVTRLQRLTEKGVSVKFVVNGGSPQAKEFVNELDKIPLLQRRIAEKNTLRLHGLGESEVIISLPHPTPPYEAFLIKDKDLTKALKQWFDARFNEMTATTL